MERIIPDHTAAGVREFEESMVTPGVDKTSQHLAINHVSLLTSSAPFAPSLVCGILDKQHDSDCSKSVTRCHTWCKNSSKSSWEVPTFGPQLFEGRLNSVHKKRPSGQPYGDRSLTAISLATSDKVLKCRKISSFKISMSCQASGNEIPMW